MGGKGGIKKKKDTPLAALIKSFNFSESVADAALKISEKLDQLDTSTTAASFDVKRYSRLASLVSEMIVMRGLLKTANLEAYEEYILEKMIDRAICIVPTVRKKV